MCRETGELTALIRSASEGLIDERVRIRQGEEQIGITVQAQPMSTDIHRRLSAAGAAYDQV